MNFIMRKVGNLIWKLFGGIAFSAVWFALGGLLTLTIVGFPLAMSCFRVGRLVWKPFGKDVALALSEYTIVNLIWSFTFGLILALLALSSFILTAVTIIGLPLAKQWLKVAKVSLFPFGAFIK